MDRYVKAMAGHPGARRVERMLAAIIADRALHPRFVNTLARMEYVGVRKMVKARRSERLDLDGLQHMLDETVHALRLKKAALALAGPPGGVATFDDGDTLAGGAGEDYLQGVDRAAQRALGAGAAGPVDPADPEANYLLTSAIIEIRAQMFYPLYEAGLRAAGASLSVAAIMRDEDRHLGDMARALERRFGAAGWRGRTEAALADEQALFDRFVDAVEGALARARAAPSAAEDAPATTHAVLVG